MRRFMLLLVLVCACGAWSVGEPYTMVNWHSWVGHTLYLQGGERTELEKVLFRNVTVYDEMDVLRAYTDSAEVTIRYICWHQGKLRGQVYRVRGPLELVREEEHLHGWFPLDED